MQNGETYAPIALIDDEPSMAGKRVSGVPVYWRDDLEQLIAEHDVSRLLLAMPSISRHRRREIITSLEPLSVYVQSIPDINDLITGRARVDEFRDVEVGDLLGRDAVPPEQVLLQANITDKHVMVTGAGGSIGSELCRQILLLEPKTLVLFEVSEYALYQINSELQKLSQKRGLNCEIKALLGSVYYQKRVQEVMETFDVETVYHAAAYKHVPVVEQNLLQGVNNNVFGTLHTARAAIEAGVETFVLISTDKAVSPTNVMGATKRLAEMVLQAIQEKQSSTRFCMVRFGNVLESSGSVVPLFREQIRAGGPVTVTHRDIIRYFMTIPEAAQLVIQAGAMAEGGDVFVLDMGEPVKIVDLAYRMIHLMGMTVRDEDNPDGDIEIEFTGLRPAEKLYEELLIGSDVSGTEHPRVLRANEEFLPHDTLQGFIDVLVAAAEAHDRELVREVLLKTVRGYAPTNGIEDLVHTATTGPCDESPSDKVISLTSRRA
jgi:FlaA1/EpsC-like NDP-sugar epimerase